MNEEVKKKKIEAAIKKAAEQNPDLGKLDNPYERIAEHLDMEQVFPEVEGENSFQWGERVEAEIDSAWASMAGGS